MRCNENQDGKWVETIIGVLTVAGIQVDFRGYRNLFEFSCTFPREFEKHSISTTVRTPTTRI